ncbi:lanthionine synthetase C family protein [Aspergillus bombycis]|uniref:Lanthionine synthetase C family protein n=1 Tax=Aspergillus bombycis TaxID=109264 RepID=A0A1F7ZTU8_9EURO|nr:lanthionine synthetase C family protein [Aspergillus bombycis]OGM42881.1 lanthionine synthetase C family protein [Aspergillus bombycis]
MNAPQYYPNMLEPLQVNKANLQKALHEFRGAVDHGTHLMQQGCPPSAEWGSAGLYLGVAGIALAFLRLERQALSLIEPGKAPIDFGKLARERIVSHGPNLPLKPGWLSPLGSLSPVTGALMRILAAATDGSVISDADITCLGDAVRLAIQNGPLVPQGDKMMGGDELIYGRPGLLWSILNLRVQHFDENTRRRLQPVFDALPDLVDVIVDAGRQGQKNYIEMHGEKDALPLMWSWKEARFYLGAVHGIAGVLAIILACHAEEVNDDTSRKYLPWIAGTITGLCKICIANHGHLPTRIPPSSRHSSPLVQLCHGSPGLLVLMACARRSPLVIEYWEPEWDEAIHLAAESIWREGLLSKGGSLCHGIAGNALPLLLMHDSFEYDVEMMQTAKRNYIKRTEAIETKCLRDNLSSDYFLSRALTLLLHARETPPYSNSPENIYRMPDRPFSLHEGLAGTVCAWADACVAIQARLRKMELELEGDGPVVEATLRHDPAFKELMNRQLGFPTIAHHRPTGLP